MKKENGISLIYIIIIVVALIAILITTTLILHSKSNNKTPDEITDSTDISTVEKKDSKIEKLSEEEKYLKIAEECEKRIAETYKSIMETELKHTPKINVEDIKYTSKYSANSNEYYYVMPVYVLSNNSVTSFRYLARCKFNEKTNKIEDYGDTVALFSMLSDLERITDGTFHVREEYYTNDTLWETENINLKEDSSMRIINALEEIDYTNVEFDENDQYYQSNKQEILKKLIEEKKSIFEKPEVRDFLGIEKINFYIAIVAAETESQALFATMPYMKNDTYVNNEALDNYINYLKQQPEFYQETLVYEK